MKKLPDNAEQGVKKRLHYAEFGKLEPWAPHALYL